MKWMIWGRQGVVRGNSELARGQEIDVEGEKAGSFLIFTCLYPFLIPKHKR